MLGMYLPICAAVATYAKKTFSESAAGVFLGLALVLNMFGMLVNLTFFIYIIYAVWTICVIYLGIHVVNSIKSKTCPSFVSIHMLIFVFGAVAIWWMCRGHRYANWDEFTHWGRAVKAVYEQLTLPGMAEIHTSFKEYPPGVAPLQAISLHVARLPFREDIVIFIQGLFALSLLMYPLHKFNIKDKFMPIFGAVMMVLAPYTVYWYFFKETTVDGLLGVLFGFVIVVEVLGTGTVFDRVLQCLACGMLPLVKSSGMLLALMAVCVMVVVRLYEEKHAQNKTQTVKNKLIKWMWTLLPAACALAAYTAWNIVISVYDIQRRWQPQGVSADDIWQLITQGQPQWRVETIQSYIANIFADTNYGWPVGFLPYMGFFVVFIAWMFGINLFAKHKKKYVSAKHINATAPNETTQTTSKINVAFWALFWLGILYTIGVLCNYLFFFSEYEAVRLASLSRYLNTYLVGMLMLLISVSVVQLRGVKWQVQAAASAGILALWAVISQPNVILPQVLYPSHSAVQSSASQNLYTAAAQEMTAVSQEKILPIYVVSQNDIGATVPRLEYELSPRSFPVHTSSIATDVPEGEILSARMSVEQWSEMLINDGYMYVYLFSVDDVFAAQYAEMFLTDADIVDGKILRVTEENGKVLLVPVN